MSDSDDMEIEKPPERRAPSARGSKGNRMAALIADEHEDEEEADKDFYTQEFWAEDEEDADFADADDEAARDSFDSDFGDSTESDEDSDEEEKATKREKIARKKSVYKDPKAKKKEAGEATSSGDAPKPKASHKKKPRSEAATLLAEGGAVAPRGSMRASTKNATELATEKRKVADEMAKQRAEHLSKMPKTKGGVELRRLTQEELLEEAKQTEIINKASLTKMLQQEEEKRKVVVREKATSGARVTYHSRRQGDSVINTQTFVECEIPEAIDGIAPPYKLPSRCPVTGLPAKYFDPVTNQPYATLEAFRQLRGRTGRRQQSFSVAASSADDGALH